MAKKTQEVAAFNTNSTQCRERRQNMTEQIRSKARELWEQKGRIQGKDLDIWLEAERIIRAGK